MTKRIFKVLAIVLATITGVVGVVVGVLALQGKFKTPEVYPYSLSFDMQNNMIIDDYDDQMYSFVLTAQSNSAHEVNHTTCYIRFINGENLITLYNNYDEIISAGSNGWYQVQCNQTLNFKLNEVSQSDFESDNYGIVTLVARDERNIVESGEFSFTIDRAIKEIVLDSDSSTIDNDSIIPEQYLTIGLSSRQDLSFVSTPEYAINPISNMDSKIVELYYNDPNNKNDLVRITNNSVSQYDFLHLDETTNQLYFESDNAGSYEFRIAVFDTYSAREEYELDTNNQGQLNSERVNNMISTNLTINVVNAEVDDVQIESSGVLLNLYSDNNYITLNNTPSDSNLNNNNNNLGLVFKSDGTSSNQTDVRYNEVDFTLTSDNSWRNNLMFESSSGATINFATTITISDLYDNEIVFDSYAITDNTLVLRNTSSGTNLNLDISYGDIKVGNKTIISNLTLTINAGLDNEQIYNFTSSNGLAFVQDNGTNKELVRLNAGSYLDFFIYNSDNDEYLLASEFNYEVVQISGTGRDKTFNLIIKNEPTLSANSHLMIGVLVVNSTGGKVMFDSTLVTIQTVTLLPGYVNGNRSYDLNVTYEQNDESYITNYGELELSDLVVVNAGTYDALILVTTDEYVGEIDTIENLTFTNNADTTYHIVGYFDEDKNFVNNVRAKEGATNIGAKLYIVQLKNAYQETASDIITRIYKENVINSNEGDVVETPYSISINDTDLVVSNFITDEEAITINILYAILSDKVNFEYDISNEFLTDNQDGSISIVEGKSDYKIIISSDVPNMLYNIYKVLGQDYFKECLSFYLYTSNDNYNKDTSILSIKSAILNEETGEIEVSFDALESSLNRDSYLKFVFEYNQTTIISDIKVRIQDTAPTDINLNYTIQDDLGNDKTISIDLASSEDLAVAKNMPYLEVQISYESGEYKYNFIFKDKDCNPLFNSTTTLQQIFTSMVSGKQTNGFEVLPAITGVEHNISYSSTDVSIFDYDFNNYLVKSFNVSTNPVAIEITSGNVTRYLKVVVSLADEFSFNATSNYPSSSDVAYLSDIINYNYKDNSIPTNAKFVNLYNIRLITFGISNMAVRVVTDEEIPNTYYLQASTGENILSIYNDEINGKGWTFDRNGYYLYTSLSIEFSVKVATSSEAKTIRLSFTSSITIDMNDGWENIYEGTNVLLYENTDSSTAFENKAIFNITNLTGDNNVSVKVGENEIISEVYNFTLPGNYTITFLFNENVISTINLTVLPNIVLEEKVTKLSSDSEYNLSDIVSLKKYNTDVTYGKKNTDTNEIPMYNDTYLDEYTSEEVAGILSSLSVQTTQNSLITATSNGLRTGWIESLNGNVVEETIQIKYLSGAYSIVLKDITLSITNKYSVEGSLSGPIKALTENAIGLSVNGFTLESISNNKNLEINLINDKFVISTYLTAPTDTILTFTFANGSENKLKFNTEITITPYLPELKDTINTIYTNSTYDLIGNVFEEFINDNVFIKNVDSFVVYSIDNTNLITNYDDIIGAGYHQGNLQYSASANIGTIVGESVKSTITYRITYANGSYYDYQYEFEVKNNTYVEVNYPFNDSSLIVNGINFEFINSEDAINLGTENGTIYDTSEYHYEPVLLGQSLNFSYDEELNVNRAKILNTNDDSLADDNFTISLVAYQSNPSGYNYYNNIIINGVNVTFRESTSLSSTASAYFIFKITSSTGAFDYYFVNLYNQQGTDFASINKTTIIKQAKISTDTGVNVLDASGNLFGVAIDSTLLKEFGITNDSITYADFDFYILDACDSTGNDIYSMFNSGELKQFDKIDDATITINNAFLTFKVALVYKPSSSNIAIHVGNIEFVQASTIIQKPESVTITLADGSSSTANIENEINGINSGKYLVNLNYNVKVVNNPFKVDNAYTDTYTLTASIKSINNDDSSIIEINATTGKIDIKKQVLNNDLIFTIKYEYKSASKSEETIVLFITYTYEAISINTSPVSASVGEFSTASGFDDKFELTNIFGNYVGDIKFSISGDEISTEEKTITYSGVIKESDDSNYNTTATQLSQNVRYIVIDGKPYLKFNLINKNYNVSIDIKFSNLSSEDENISEDEKISRTINMNVAMGLSYSSNPYTITNPYEANKEGTISDTTNYGSSLSFTYSSSSTSNYVAYILGEETTGLTIYVYSQNIETTTTTENEVTDNGETTTTSASTSLDITFSEPGYVANKGETNNIVITGNSGNVQFVHSAMEKDDLQMNIAIKLGSNYFITDSLDNAKVTIPVLVRTPQTYKGIQAIYDTVGSNHEVVNSSSSIDNIVNNLLRKETTTKETTEEDTTNNIFNKYKLAIVDMNDKLITDYDPTSIGFINSGNPNFLKFTAGANTTISVQGNEYSVNFASVSANSEAIIYITNDTMIESLGQVEYKYLIMPNSERFTFSENVTTGTYTSGEKDYQYAVALINDSTKTSDFNTAINFGSLKDATNSVLYASSIKMNGASTEATYTKNNNQIKIEVSDYYKVYIEVSDSKELIFTIERDATATITIYDNLYFDITLYGDGLICENYRFMFVNYSIENNSNSQIYASTQLNLDSVVEIKANNNNTSTLSMQNAELNTNNSYYIIEGEKVYISSATNELFSYNETTKVIEFSPVAEDISTHIEFLVKIKINGVNYYIGSVVFDWVVNVNHEYVINGVTFSDPNERFTTNYILTTNNLTKTTESGEIIYEFPYNDSISKDISDTISYNGKYYYTTINFVVRDVLTKTNIALADTYLEFVITNLEEIGYINGEPIVTIENNSGNYQLKILKDFTGDVNIEVVAGFIHVGEFVRSWTISVQGFANFDYTSNENTILTTAGGEPFVSGTEVSPINVISGEGTGIVIKDTNNITSLGNEITYTLDNITYVDIVNSNITSIQTAFENEKDNAIKLTSDISNGVVKTTLPYVEQSSSTAPIYHIIIMKIEISYFDNSVTKYVAYQVYNNLRVEQSNSANINVDETNQILTIDTESSKANLSLLYYADVYSNTTNNSTYTITMTDKGQYTLTIHAEGSEDTKITSDDCTTFTDTDSGITYTINQNTIVLSGNTSETINVTKSSVTNNNTIFSSSFNNINEFANFINDIKYIQLSNVTGFANENAYDIVYYKLIHFDDGVWGINLLDPYSDSSFENNITLTAKILFNGELIAKLEIVQTNSKITINEYSSNNTNGFRLYGNTQITPIGNGFTLSEMFNLNEINSQYANYKVIGIFSGESVDTSWVNSATSYKINDAISGAILNSDYTLYSITYTGESTTSIYNAQATYYAIKTSSSDITSIVKVNYTTSPSYFNVEYPTSGDAVFNMSNRFIEFKMIKDSVNKDKYILAKEYLTIFDVEYKSSGTTDPFANILGSDKVTTSSITLSVDALNEYKLNNPSATFVDLTFTANNNIDFVVRFRLPNAVYKITLNHNYEGSTNNAKYILPGQNLAIDEPTRDGFTFAGWYLDSECQNAWDSDTTTISNDITLYAKWTENSAVTD